MSCKLCRKRTIIYDTWIINLNSGVLSVTYWTQGFPNRPADQEELISATKKKVFGWWFEHEPANADLFSPQSFWEEVGFSSENALSQYGPDYFSRERFVSIPLWLVQLLSVTPLLIYVFHRLRTHALVKKRIAERKCPHCGYDLRGTPSGCPECGWKPSRR